jgi:hypothetical protein
MQAMIDLVGSIIFGGALLLIVINANQMASENQSVYNGDMLVQEMLVQTAHLVEGEFRNMGVGVPEGTRTILSADSSDITFLYDADRNGSIDTVRYLVGLRSEMASSPNELDRPLYRRVNHESLQKVGVVTVFRLKYIRRSGEEITTPVALADLSEIFSVEITMEVQNPFAVLRSAGTQAGQREELYSSSLWQQTRLASQNFRR